MNACDKIRQNAFLYQENALEPVLAKEVRNHLAACPDCQKQFQQAASLKKAMKSLPKYRTSPDFNTVLRARLRTEAKRKPLWDFSLGSVLWRVPAFAVMAVVFIAIGVIMQRNWRLAPIPVENNQLMAVQSGPLQTVEQPPPTAIVQPVKRAAVKNYVDPAPITDMKKWMRQRGLRNQGSLERLNDDSTRLTNEQPQVRTLVRQANQVRF
jgi:hypothetical protein